MIPPARPQGFYRVVTVSGKTELAFNCERCHHGYIPAPETVRHCGKIETFKPGLFEKLPVVKLPYGRMAVNMIEV